MLCSTLPQLRFSGLFKEASLGPSGFKGLLGLGLLVMATNVSKTHAEEVKTFRVTGTKGHAAIRYNTNERTFQLSGGSTSEEKRPKWEQELFLLTNGYVYHPNFLDFNLGGGLLSQQSSFESTAGENSNNSLDFAFTTELNFLNKKPYPFSLFYDRGFPTVSVAPAGFFETQNTLYGGNFSLRRPLSPVTLNLRATHRETEGSGFDQILDDQIDQITLRAHRTFGVGSFAQLLLRTDDQVSRSGSINLPRQESTNTTDSANLHTRFLFGDSQQITFTNVVNYTTQNTQIGASPFPERTRLDFLPDLRWRHTDKLDSFHRYSYRSTEQGAVDNLSQSLLTGINYRYRPDLFGSADLHAEDEDSSGLMRRLYGVSGSVTYQRPIPWGVLQLSYGGKYDVSNQESAITQIPVVGESIVLSGTTPVALANDFFIPGSILVSSIDRGQTFVEGLDYRLISVGSETQIQRIISGNIVDGQTILIDYQYQAGGSFDHTLLDQNVQASATLFRYWNIFARFRDLSIDVTDGVPTTPVNPVQRISYGGRVDYPFRNGWTAGASLLLEDQDEVISPYQRESFDAYVELPLPYVSTLKLSARVDNVDNERSLEDVELTGYALQLNSRPWPRTSIRLISSFEEDSGGTLPRTTRRNTINMEWRKRQLRFSLQARHTDDEQGTFRQKRMDIFAILRRDINL